jgi:hypothetical protein
VDDPHRRFGNRVEAGIGDHQRDLDDAVGVRIETRHLHVDPDEVVAV